MAEPPPEEISLPLVWVGLDEVPVLVSNQMALQFSAPEEFLLSFGVATPPLLVGTPEQIAAQVERLAYAEVKPVARLGFNRQRLKELIDLLERQLATYDRIFQTREEDKK